MKVLILAVFILILWAGVILSHRRGHGRRFGRHRGSGRFGARNCRKWSHGGSRISYIEGPTSPVLTTVNLSPGKSELIRSQGFFQPSSSNYNLTWNVLAPGNNIEVRCTIQFSSFECRSPSLTVGDSQYTTGYQSFGPITKADRIDIIYTNQGGNCIFSCIAKTSSSSVPILPLDLQDPSSWTLTNPKCAGSRQSPVDIETTSLIGIYPWKELGVHQYDTPLQSMTLSNDGRSVTLRATGPFVMGGNLSFNNQYLLQDVVFHWGPTSTTGSEHTFNGQRYAGEIQLIHYNKKYGDYDSALEIADDGLAILSTFLEVTPNDNAVFNPVVSALKNIRASGSSTTVSPFSLRGFLPENIGEFYRYGGSLTRPGCQEAVTWTIFNDTVGISSAQLAEFRNLEDSNGNKISSNIRPVQNLSGRKILAGQLEPSWSHNGPDGQDVWPLISASCGGDSQSPIDIQTASTVLETFSPLALTNFSLTPDKMVLLNNDHGAVILPAMEYRATIQGGPFITPYNFFHYHFHWGSPTTNGSEHTINGRRYPGEIHMLVNNQSLGGLQQSLGVERGIYEISVFLEFSEADNPKLANIISGLEKVVPSLSSTELTPFPLDNLLPSFLGDYYVYNGSLTAPAPICDEMAYFLVFKEPITISRNQMERFYNLENAAGYKIQNSFRNLQPLNGRLVSTS
ncbi:uncharacterized protein [Palaemon carinicauda]|uniref:uncharacterized protein n=1 Tax=Palaemon carinicauda TaxID=392227 RepID=UPI0035B59C9D